jgi:hypothetical protein
VISRCASSSRSASRCAAIHCSAVTSGSSCSSTDPLLEGVGQRGGLLGLSGQIRPLGRVGGRVGGGLAAGGQGAVVVAGLDGPGQLVVHPAGRPALLPLIRPHAQAEPAVGHLRFVAVGVRPAQRPPGGAPGSVRFDQPGRGRRSDRGGVVVVVRQLPMSGDDPGPSLPVQPVGRVGRYRAERVERPRRRVADQLRAELVATRVGRLGDLLEVGAGVGARDGGQPLPVGVPVGVEPVAMRLDDAGVDDVGQLPRPAQIALADRGGQRLVGVVPGQLDPTQNPADGRGAVLGGDPPPLAL